MSILIPIKSISPLSLFANDENDGVRALSRKNKVLSPRIAKIFEVKLRKDFEIENTAE